VAVVCRGFARNGQPGSFSCPHRLTYFATTAGEVAGAVPPWVNPTLAIRSPPDAPSAERCPGRWAFPRAFGGA